MKKKGMDYFNFLLGLIITALSFNAIFSPNDLVTGGVSGLAIILKNVFSLNESLFILIMNLFLILLSFICLGKEKTKNTILGSILFPVFVYLTQDISSWFHLEMDPILIAVLGGMASGLGYGLVFRSNFTTGGTDILNQMTEKYFKIPMSKSILYIDGSIVLAGGFVFGITKMMYSLISLSLISIISNRIQLGINHNRVLYITSKKQNQIKDFLQTLGYDATIMNRIGGYTKEKGMMLMVSISQKDYYLVRNAMKEIDENAFLVVTNAYEQKNANVQIRKSIKE